MVCLKALARLGLFIFAVSLPGAAHADTISIIADVWCPYNCEPDAKELGYGIEIAKAIFEPAGHTVTYQLSNYTRSIERTRKGDYVAVIGMTPGDAPDFVFPKEILGETDDGLITRAEDGFVYKGPESLDGRVLATIQSYTYGEVLQAYVDRHQKDKSRIDTVGGDDALAINFKKLMAKRVDVVTDDSNVARHQLKLMGLLDKVSIQSVPGKRAPIYLGFSPANPKAKAYAELFDKGFVALRVEGKLKAILDRYGLKDWK